MEIIGTIIILMTVKLVKDGRNNSHCSESINKVKCKTRAWRSTDHCEPSGMIDL